MFQEHKNGSSSSGLLPQLSGSYAGGPTSPYLFILGKEVLSILLKKAETGGCITSCSIRGREGAFADDTIVFCKANEDQLLYLSWVLFWFETTSSLKINLDKSVFYSIRVVVNLDALAVELGCQVDHLPTTNLGLPLGDFHKSHIVWDHVDEKLRKRLALWKRYYVSKKLRKNCYILCIISITKIR